MPGKKKINRKQNIFEVDLVHQVHGETKQFWYFMANQFQTLTYVLLSFHLYRVEQQLQYFSVHFQLPVVSI